MQALLAILIALVFASAPVAQAATRPATVPTSRSSATRYASREASRAVRAAMAALEKEYASKDRRTKCTYFKDHPSKEINDAAIVQELTAPSWQGGSAAYVRWQLLSGLSESPDEKTAKALLAAYQNAPGPLPRPGIAVGEQQQLDRALAGKRLADEPDVKRQAELMFEASAKENQPILAYREELYRRLPKNLDAFAAAVTDLSARLAVVADGKELVKAFARDVQDWATTANPPPQQLLGVASVVRKLADSKGPYYYGSVAWRESSRSFAWSKTRSGIDSGTALKDLAASLEQQSRQPPISLETKR